MAIEALGHRLVIRPDRVESDAQKAKEQATVSGIVLPASVDKNLEDEALREQAGIDQGIVIGIGKTAFKDFGGEPWCQVGDYIAYARHAGKYIKDPETDERVLLINDEDVLCRITPKKES